MAATNLGLELRDTALAAVKVKIGIRGCEILDCGHVDRQPGRPLDEALDRLGDQIDLRADTCVLTLPGNRLLFRHVTLPFKDARKIRQTLPYEIEPLVPVPVEDLVVDFLASPGPGQSRVLAACALEREVAEVVEALRASGLEPAALDVHGVPAARRLMDRHPGLGHGLLLDLGNSRSHLVLWSEGNMVLARCLPGGDARALASDLGTTLHAFGACAGPAMDLEAVYLTGPGSRSEGLVRDLNERLGTEVIRLDLLSEGGVGISGEARRRWEPERMNGALAAALRVSRTGGFNFLQAGRNASQRRMGIHREIRGAVLVAAAVLGLLLADLSLETHRLEKQASALDQQIHALFRRTFPEVGRIVDPVAQARIILRRRQSGPSRPAGLARRTPALELLRDISARVPEQGRLRLDRMTIEPEWVRMSGETAGFHRVEALKQALEDSPLLAEVTIGAAHLGRERRRVQFEIRAARAERETP